MVKTRSGTKHAAKTDVVAPKVSSAKKHTARKSPEKQKSVIVTPEKVKVSSANKYAARKSPKKKEPNSATTKKAKLSKANANEARKKRLLKRIADKESITNSSVVKKKQTKNPTKLSSAKKITAMKSSKKKSGTQDLYINCSRGT